MPDPLRGHRRWLLSCLLVTAAAGCSGAPRPPAEPPGQTVSGVPPTQPPAEAPAPAPPPPPAAEPQTPPPQIVIEPAEPEPDSQPTLVEAAQWERERRSRAGKPTIVITDANLQEHAVGELTFIEDDAPEAGEEGEEQAAATAAATADEQYWRDRVREIRQRWADAASQVPELETQVAELRRRFYEADDPYYRDSRIKPAWDRAIDLIAQARAEAEAHRLELEAVLEEGRLAGALPGWLREGVELEPTPEEPESDTHEPGEPVVVEPGEGGGDP